MTPSQFTTEDQTLLGAVNGVNQSFKFYPRPYILQYSVPSATGNLLFRNGLLIDSPIDYTEGAGYFVLRYQVPNNTITAVVFTAGEPGAGATKLRLNAGISSMGSASLWLTPSSPGNATMVPFMLFRNGQLLTNGLDYSLSGPWITLLGTQTIRPGDTYTALISMLGSPCSTFDGSIGGGINGVNATFYIPQASFVILFRNGQFLTQGLDYIRVPLSQPIIQPGTQPELPGKSLPGGATPGFGSQYRIFQSSLVMLENQIPKPGDVLTAQIWNTGGPIQITNIDGSLFPVSATKSLLFSGGEMDTQPMDGYVEANAAFLTAPPLSGSSVTVESWVPDITAADQPAFNLPQQFSTGNGLLLGAVNGANQIFVLATMSLVTQLLLWWNGNFLQQGTQFNWSCVQNSSAGPWTTTITMIGSNVPAAGDIVTAQIFSM